MPSFATLATVFIEAAILIPALVILTRLAGLRSFSKMSGYDFAITVAMGSVLAGVLIGTKTSVWIGLAGFGALFLVQMILSRLRVHWPTMTDAMDNDPLLIMDGQRILDDNLTRAKMTRGDLFGKLREANVLQMSEVQAVVFEPTGDVSVLHGDCAVDDELLESVRRSH